MCELGPLISVSLEGQVNVGNCPQPHLGAFSTANSESDAALCGAGLVNFILLFQMAICYCFAVISDGVEEFGQFTSGLGTDGYILAAILRRNVYGGV